MTDPRPRLVERLREAGAYRVTIIAAPAGFGKSTVLSQFLEGAQRCSRVDIVPGMTTAQLAAGLTAALEAATETITVDGVDALSDPASGVAALVDCIERSVHVSWIVATRTVSGLPLGTWLAHRDCELVVESADLQYTRDEIADAALRLGFGLADDELDDIVALTEGWPPAVGVALRAAARAQNRARLNSTVRDAAYWYFQEAVYPGLASAERELLTVAVALPEIDVGLLELAGFPRAHEAIDALRGRTMLLERGPNGTYRCLSLFRGFLRRQIEVAGSQEIARVYSAAARGLEAADRVGDALDAFICAKSHADVLRLLEQSGFDLLERGQSSVIGRAVDVLNEPDKRLNPHVLALRGVLQSIQGDVVSAEALLRRSLADAGDQPVLTSTVSIRLALLLTNQGREINTLLEPVASDVSLSASDRAEAWSLMAASAALSGASEVAKSSMSQLDDLLDDIESESIRARVLQRIGVAAAYIGELDRARLALTQAASLAMELSLYSLASRAYANLSNLMLHYLDDVALQLRYAELAFMAAIRASDAFDIETASLQLLDAELRLGVPGRAATLEKHILDARGEDRSRAHYLSPARALRLAWEGRFAEAHRMLGPSWSRLHHGFDQAVTGAQLALYLALDEKKELSAATTARVLELLDATEVKGPFNERSITVARLCCALAEALSGRRTRGDRIIRRIPSEGEDAVVSLLREIGERMLAGIRRRNRSDPETLSALMQQLHPLGYGHVAQFLKSVTAFVEARKPSGSGVLTAAESSILALLADGLSPKEIAGRRGSSINTVRKHIARSIVKLRCNGRAEAVALGRRLGLLAESSLGA